MESGAFEPFVSLDRAHRETRCSRKMGMARIDLVQRKRPLARGLRSLPIAYSYAVGLAQSSRRLISEPPGAGPGKIDTLPSLSCSCLTTLLVHADGEQTRERVQCAVLQRLPLGDRQELVSARLPRAKAAHGAQYHLYVYGFSPPVHGGRAWLAAE
jgi:hypothetical protein